MQLRGSEGPKCELDDPEWGRRAEARMWNTLLVLPVRN